MRARNIKPGFFKNDELAELDPIVRLLFVGLWCYADKAGRFEWRPKRIKAEILPYDNGDITVMLRLLHDQGFIQRYTVNGYEYGRVVNFEKHQKPHHTEKNSELPSPEEADQEKQHENNDLPNNGDLTVKTPLKDGETTVASRSDSLIPDSLIPDSLNTPPKPPQGGSPSQAKPSSINNIPYKEIIQYLNEKTGKDFKHTTKETRRFIKARWNAGFRLEDFKIVIDRKVAKWSNDPKMVDYLRPETLFGTKFESYLNEKTPEERLYSEVTVNNLKSMKTWLEGKNGR
jgi:uncharacterized phage protein (TIGR02220 family)